MTRYLSIIYKITLFKFQSNQTYLKICLCKYVCMYVCEPIFLRTNERENLLKVPKKWEILQNFHFDPLNYKITNTEKMFIKKI